MSQCAHCNAPLPHGQIRCKYCGAANDIDLSGRHHYTTHAPETPRPCPACQTALQTLNIGKGNLPFYIERCAQCQGLFFDPGELDALVRETVQGVYSIDPLRLAALRENAPAEPERIQYRPCPVCHKLMNRQNFGERSGIIIDRCREHGVFLDAGELQRVFQWVHSGGALQTEQQKSYEKAPPAPRISPEDPEDNPEYIQLRGILGALGHFLSHLLR